ncbi:CPBP family intramembrane glutamic endopeptidase [Deinococcus yavapaiensis]|uniref:CAAX prenyl protease 2/Lysostaphin resistance protein A-like domain-containing protein n=1 Tax=Deinococcus yavapaiensis KR-236 TaxID=694435 RepID=A0A318SBC5_9DEIO|nr:type II CAAX endopeptidase family protein [Deinococcus yavapaiensis]PYE55664.1 hypothetical protein DES52_10227 [Deinococcus yavapaiensis KR-236]
MSVIDTSEKYAQRSSLALLLELSLYILMMIAAESFAAGPSPLLGLWLHALTLIVLTVRATLFRVKHAEVLIALSLAPLIRLLALTIPTQQLGLDTINVFPIVNLPLILAALLGIRVLSFKAKNVGLRLSWRDVPLQLLIASSGFLIGYGERLILQPPALAAGFEPRQLIWPMLSLMVFTGLSEELLFRGVMQHAAVRHLGPRVGVVLISVVFGVFHFGWQSWLDVVYVTLVGLYFGWLAHKTRSIVGISVAHGIANIMLFVVLPLLGK